MLFWSPVPLKGTGDYILLLAGSRDYVYRIIKEMRGYALSVDLQSQESRQPRKLHRERHMVLVLTLARFTSVSKLLLFQFNN